MNVDEADEDEEGCGDLHEGVLEGEVGERMLGWS